MTNLHYFDCFAVHSYYHHLPDYAHRSTVMRNAVGLKRDLDRHGRQQLLRRQLCSPCLQPVEPLKQHHEKGQLWPHQERGCQMSGNDETHVKKCNFGRDASQDAATFIIPDYYERKGQIFEVGESWIRE